MQRSKDTKVRNTKTSKYRDQKIQTLEIQEKPNTEVPGSWLSAPVWLRLFRISRRCHWIKPLLCHPLLFFSFSVYFLQHNTHIFVAIYLPKKSSSHQSVILPCYIKCDWQLLQSNFDTVIFACIWLYLLIFIYVHILSTICLY